MTSAQSAHGGLHRTATRWLVVVLLAIAVIGLAGQVLRSEPSAVAQSSAGEGDSPVLAVAGQISGETYGLYLFDRRSRIITMYEWVPATRKLRLLAARNTTYDQQLDEYNTEPPPSEIQKLVQQGERLGVQAGSEAAPSAAGE